MRSTACLTSLFKGECKTLEFPLRAVILASVLATAMYAFVVAVASCAHLALRLMVALLLSEVSAVPIDAQKRL